MGELIKRARETRGQTLRDVAYVLRCHVNSVWRWENGKSLPHGYHLRQLEAAYPELKVAA